MKIVLIAINSQYIHTNLAVHYIKSSLIGYDCDIFESNVNKPIDETISNISNINADVYAFSTYIFNIDYILALLVRLKAMKPFAKFVLGGIEAENRAEELIKLCDVVLVGDGEIVFRQWLENGAKNGISIVPKTTLDNTYSPYTDEYFALAKGKIAYFEASRGCPFNCTYCMSCKDKLRLYNIDYIKCELSKFFYKDIKVLKFVDRTFNLKCSYPKNILRFLSDNIDKFPFPIHFEVAPELFDDEYFDIISKVPVGKFQFEVGMQSFNEKTLAAIKRAAHENIISDNINRLISLKNVMVHCDLIAGLPYEDIVSLKRSFDTLYLLKPHEIQLGLLKVLPGSEMETTLPCDYVYSHVPPYAVISTPYLSKEEIKNVCLAEKAINKLYNSGKFQNTLKRFISSSPFDFYFNFACFVGDFGNLKYENLMQKLSNFLCNNLYAEKIEVIELLRLDYYLTNNSRKTPKILYRDYVYSNTVRRKLSIENNNAYIVEFNLNLDSLRYSKKTIIIAIDYDDFNPITRSYAYKILNNIDLQ